MSILVIDTNSFSLYIAVGPTLEDLPDEVNVLEGGTATVTFTANANPAVTNDSVTVTRYSDDVGSYTVAINGSTITLTFPNLTRDAEDSYYVDVSNSQGMANDSFMLIVNCE